ncbi:MAG: hypothetical protein AB2814_08555 [Candidatus Sedimenticola endophacoides]
MSQNLSRGSDTLVPTGTAKGYNITFTFCPGSGSGSGSTDPKALILSATGRPR